MKFLAFAKPSARRRSPLLVACFVFAAVAALKLGDAAVLQRAQLFVFDSYQQVWPREYRQAPVRVIDIDEASLEKLGQWPWPRRTVAKLIDRLTAMGAASIGLDVLFAEPDRSSPSRLRAVLEADGFALPENAEAWPDFDAELAAAFKNAPVVAAFGLHGTPNDAKPKLKAGVALIGEGAAEAVHRYPGAVVNLPELEATARGNGSFSVVSETDKVIRAVPIVSALDGEIYPSMTLEALRVAQRAGSIAVKARPNFGIESVRVGRLETPLERDGEMRVYYTEHAPTRSVPAWRILEDDPAAVASLVRGHIVLVGFSAVGLVDLRATPLNPFEPGVNIHAQTLEQIILKDWLTRPAWAELAEIAAAAVAALAIALLLARVGGGAGAVAAGVSLAAFFGGSMWAYAELNLLLDPSFAGLAVASVFLTAFTLVYFRTEFEKRHIRAAFQQYLSPGLVEQISENPEQLALGGEAREMTFLFTDLEGFTSLTEGMEPEKLVKVLNGYLDGLCVIVMNHGGAVDKIVGDAVHAMFNAPVSLPDHAERAVRCALEMDEFSMDYIEKMAAEGVKLGVTRIGVNTGRAIVGNFGGAKRLDYTAHGDAINTAARLEAANKFLGTRICVAGSTVAQCPSIAFRPIGELMLKGKQIGVETHEPVVALDDARDMLGRYETAMNSLAAGDVDEAEAILAALAKDHPDDPLVKLHAARVRDGDGGRPITIR